MALDTFQHEELTVSHGGPELVYDQADFEELLRTLVEEVFPPDKVEENLPKKREFIQEQLRQPESVAIFDGNKLIAFAGVREMNFDHLPDDVYFELKSLVVNKDYRGRGLAKILTEEREKSIAQKVKNYGHGVGCVRYFLTKNVYVIASAEKRGYEPVGTRVWLAHIDPELQGSELEALIIEIERDGLKFFKNDSLSAEKVNGVKFSINKAVELVLSNDWIAQNVGALKTWLKNFHSRVRNLMARE